MVGPEVFWLNKAAGENISAIILRSGYFLIGGSIRRIESINLTCLVDSTARMLGSIPCMNIERGSE